MRNVVRFKMTMRTVLTTAVLMVSTSTASGEEFAYGGLQRSCFSYAAVAMSPYDLTISAGLFRKTHERVYHTDGKTGTILLYGPVHPWIQQYGDGISFSVTYIDPDGPGPEAQVTAELRHVGPAGITSIAKLDSNGDAVATNESQVMSTGVAWNELNRQTGYYVVRVYVKRSNTSLRPAVFGYNLCSTVF